MMLNDALAILGSKKYQIRIEGEPNFISIIDTKTNNWIAQIQFNGALTSRKQEALALVLAEVRGPSCLPMGWYVVPGDSLELKIYFYDKQYKPDIHGPGYCQVLIKNLDSMQWVNISNDWVRMSE